MPRASSNRQSVTPSWSLRGIYRITACLTQEHEIVHFSTPLHISPPNIWTTLNGILRRAISTFRSICDGCFAESSSRKMIGRWTTPIGGRGFGDSLYDHIFGRWSNFAWLWPCMSSCLQKILMVALVMVLHVHVHVDLVVLSRPP